MKYSLGICTVLVQSVLFAAPDFKLPPVVATCGNTRLTADEIAPEWQKILDTLPDDCSEEMANHVLQRLAEKHIWQKEISAMLQEAEIPINRQTAQRYLNEQIQSLPAEQIRQLRQANPNAPDSRDMQLKAAIHYYLKKNVPDQISVSDEEAEHFYRKNQTRFRQPGKVTLGIIETADKNKAEMARASLLQGESFDRVAAKFDPEGAGIPSQEALAIVRTLKEREITPLLRAGKHWQVIQLRSRTPDRFIPFEKVKPRICFELSAIREGRMMGKLLSQRMARKKILFQRITRGKAATNKINKQ